MFIVFDTETTGLPDNYNAPVSDSANWPRLVQLAWQEYNSNGHLTGSHDFIIKPDGFIIPYSAEKVHGISTERALREGVGLKSALSVFMQAVSNCQTLVAHNISFDLKIVGAELYRMGMENLLEKRAHLCTKENSTDFCALSGGRGGKYKWPNLAELYCKLFNTHFEEAHNAAADVGATARCFIELVRAGVLNASLPALRGVELKDFGKGVEKLEAIASESEQTSLYSRDEQVPEISEAPEGLSDSPLEPEIVALPTPASEKTDTAPFIHLHLHTQYSILDGAADIEKLMAKAKADNMSAIAITDHGNMFGVKEFHSQAKKHGLKPILGCEAYVARRGMKEKSDKYDGGGFHLVLLAKNTEGYHNLIRLVSLGWTEGFYYKPRIDKELLKKYHKGLIASSACLNGEVSYILRHEGYEAAREAALEYKSIFGEDYYLELQRHQSGNPEIDGEVFKDQVYVNENLIKLGKELGIKLVATNDVHFINKEDAAAHDRLLCISTGKFVDETNRLRYTRQEWFKTSAEMNALFQDNPEALTNTLEVAAKVENYPLDSPPIMPYFEIPEGFVGADAYLRHITIEGAARRYPEMGDSILERINFELETVKKMGFPDYFLIVWDFIRAAREMGVSVGPGRGSAAGSVVAYCLRITDIDPVKYNLLFERFLNPDRVSMPDIDIDFDEDGREKVLEYVVNKYGRNKVAQIITFGTMAPKMAIRDVARVQRLPLTEADRLAKLVPEKPGTTFIKAYDESPGLAAEKKSTNELVAQTLQYAEVLEGSVRQTGVHACGVIISRDNLEEHIPICTSKEADLFVTQYDGKHIESVGMLKMDFLGLKTLSIIKDTVENIKKSKGIEINIDTIPLDDSKTYELYSRGDSTGLFQFESDGMKKYLRMLKPNRFEDLIAMNALYRPGPMDYIPRFIRRKLGQEPIMYDIPEMEEYLKDTYGITVYQEQVMLLSQKLAGFTKGMADSLRKAMGKKIRSMMDQLKEKFVEGCAQNGYDEPIVQKIWKDWESFAEYAFNKSHSTCYAWISYQTAFLKAHYPAEFMASVLSRNLSDIKKITFFMDECRRMGMNVLVPDINESYARFTVNRNGNIRFGLAAIKGVGEAAVEHIINERDRKGPFKSIYDFAERINLNTINKRCLEALVMAGGLDSFEGIDRSWYFSESGSEPSFIEQLIKYGNKIQSEANGAPTLFDDLIPVEVVKPQPPKGSEWTTLIRLNKEKELIGVYLSAHPLDNYRLEINAFCNTQLSELRDLKGIANREITCAGIVTSARNAISKNGKPYGTMTIEDFSDSYNLTCYGKDYEILRNYFFDGYPLMIKGNVVENQWKKEKGELEFKIKSISLLSNVRDEMIKSICINLPLVLLTEEIIEELKKQTSKQGKVELNFKVIDQEDRISVDLFARNQKIALSDALVRFLVDTAGLEFRLS